MNPEQDLDRFSAPYRNLLAQVDAWFDEAGQRLGNEISCSAGCHGCCRGLFDITFLDAHLLWTGLQELPEHRQRALRNAARERLRPMRQRCPGFDVPFILNDLPQAERSILFEQDEAPCVLLDGHGRCLLYAHRPLTCRLHGLPQYLPDGTLFDSDACSLNRFSPAALAALPGLDFNALFRQEATLIRQQAGVLLGHPRYELDTLIPAALLLDFDVFSGERVCRER